MVDDDGCGGKYPVDWPGWEYSSSLDCTTRQLVYFPNHFRVGLEVIDNNKWTDSSKKGSNAYPCCLPVSPEPDPAGRLVAELPVAYGLF